MIKSKRIKYVSIFVMGLFILLSGQKSYNQVNTDYEKLWNEVDSIIYNGLIEDAIKKVENIYSIATSEKNQAQIYKCIIHIEMYKAEKKAQSIPSLIKQLEKSLKILDKPIASLIQSNLGELYMKYARNDHFEDYRSNIEDIQKDSTDITSWSANNLTQKANEYFLESVRNKELINYPTKDFKAILSMGMDSVSRPSLYDILMYRAISHFGSIEARSSDFNNSIPDSILFGSVDEFKNADLSNHKVFQLYQNMMKHNSKNDNKEGFIDAYLNGLAYSLNLNQTDLREKMYLNAMNQFYIQNIDFPGVAHVLFDLAQFYERNTPYYFTDENSAKSNYKLKADSICNLILHKFPSSNWIKNTISLKDQIHFKRIHFEIEDINLPNEPFRILLDYTNLTSVHIKVHSLSSEEFIKINNKSWTHENINLDSSKLIQSYSETLPETKDFLSHSIELKIDPLPVGMYYITVSSNKDHSKECVVAGQKFQVSQLASITHKMDGNSISHYIVDRKYGKPIPGAEVQFYTNKSSYYDDLSKILKDATKITDIDGQVSIPNNKQTIFVVNYKNDTFVNSENYFRNTDYRGSEDSYRAIFFTDRRLYKPGQTVFFKVISIMIDTNDLPSIVANAKFSVSLYSTNRINTNTINIKTNQYGSGTGSFVIPKNGLNGEYYLDTDTSTDLSEDEDYNSYESRYWIQVEDYKRPNFEVIFDTIKEEVNLTKPITIRGKAISFNGIPISNGTVNYNISKNEFSIYIPYWCFYKPIDQYYSFHNSGSTKTNELGQFEFQFNPSSDRDKIFPDALYKFTMTADVTDQNGETQSNFKDISVSMKKIFLATNLKPYYDNQNILDLTILTKNIEEEPLKSKLNVKIYNLDVPHNFIRNRLWKKPDFNKYSIQEFKIFFPEDVYYDEDKIMNWAKLKLVLDSSIHYTTKSQIAISKITKPGTYKIEIDAISEYGTYEKWENYFVIYDELSKNSNPYPELLSLNDTIYPTSPAIFNALPIGNEYFILSSFHSRTQNKVEWKGVNRLKNWTFPITENDRGKVFFAGSCIYNNRPFNFTKNIIVPWSNKNINIKTISFRNKLLPGQKENWSFEIEPCIKDTFRIEVLASMYDASLDQILPFQWENNFWPEIENKGTFAISSIAISNSSHIKMTRLNYYHINNTILKDYFENNRSFTTTSVAYKMSSINNNQSPYQRSQFDNYKKVVVQKSNKSDSKKFDTSQVRKNLNETVFFYPQLYPTKEGKISITFTMNEALTKWKLQLFAHSQDLKSGLQIFEIVTQKPIQIKPFYPRFMRQGDEIVLSASVSNLSTKTEIGKVSLSILDANTLEDITNKFITKNKIQKFELNTNKTKSYKWLLKIPKTQNTPVIFRYLVKGKNHTDGEENQIPIVTNRKLITESLPLWVGKNETRNFNFKSLNTIDSICSSTPYKFVLEFSSHPIWYAVQNLRYIMEFPFECNEQLMSRLFANTIGTFIMEEYPKVSSTLSLIKKNGENKSPLLNNNNLKSAIIEEIPWLLTSKNESEQLKSWSLLLDMEKMETELEATLLKLEQRQYNNGAWPWFPGGNSDWYITQHIVNEIGHLKKLGAIKKHITRYEIMVQKAKTFLEDKMRYDYELLAKQVKLGNANWEDNHLGNRQLLFLYSKTFYPDWQTNVSFLPIEKYYLNQINKYWHSGNIYKEGLCALIAKRNRNTSLAELIIKSLKQRAIKDPELGMYWNFKWSWYWYELPVETQSLLIEAFYEISKDQLSIDEMKVWILKNKQTQHWESTKATTAGIYALLGFGSNTINETIPVEIKVGNEKIKRPKESSPIGYIKQEWQPENISPSMANISISNPNKSIAWGSVFYQYFEDLDKVKDYNETSLILHKDLYIKTNTKSVKLLKPVNDQSKIKLGDVITARIIIKVDRPMDYVHLKVMRSSGLEPINQISQYIWQGELGYYCSPRDLATDFFIDYLPAGTHIIEYDLRASFKGEFSDGISTIQSMYAPEFGAHSKGIRLNITN